MDGMFLDYIYLRGNLVGAAVKTGWFLTLIFIKIITE
jgi:hypothetical protein